MIMEMTQDDYNSRAARIDDGTATDDDRRLVELYEREGYTRDSDDSQAVGITAVAEAEVIRGEDKSAPKKNTRRPAR
jgi:hypothetical protein